jgi:hypothetical protein
VSARAALAPERRGSWPLTGTTGRTSTGSSLGSYNQAARDALSLQELHMRLPGFALSNMTPQENPRQRRCLLCALGLTA